MSFFFDKVKPFIILFPSLKSIQKFDMSVLAVQNS